MKTAAKKIVFISVCCIALSCSIKNTGDNPVDPITVPASSSQLVIAEMTETSVLLQWKNNGSVSPADTSAANIVERSNDEVLYTAAATVSVRAASVVLSGTFLTTEKYYFRIKTITNSHLPVYSNVVSQMLPFPEPSELGISSFTASQAVLHWSDNSSFETGFEIERSENGSGFTKMKSVVANETSATLTGQYDSAVTYSFRIRAVSVRNVSAYSNVLQYNMAAASDMFSVRAGTFTMGSAPGTEEIDEEPQHSVTLSGFSISKTEMQQGMWDTVSQWGIRNGYVDLPAGKQSTAASSVVQYSATSVNWYDIIKWCNARSEKEGLTPVYYTSSLFAPAAVYKTGEIDIQNTMVNWSANGYRLPTEAEWEYAAIGGMKCNIWQWCSDWYGAYTSASQTDPHGSPSGTVRIVRGFSTGDYGIFRPANREFNAPGVRNFLGIIGFRCVRRS